jgi:hypothetical protein
MYQGVWPPEDPSEAYLRELAEEYHRRAEEYDRTVCTGPVGRDGILPASHYELTMINRNALSLKRELEDRAMSERGIGSQQVTKAIQRYSR